MAWVPADRPNVIPAIGDLQIAIAGRAPAQMETPPSGIAATWPGAHFSKW
jgi:hypothetical protein